MRQLLVLVEDYVDVAEPDGGQSQVVDTGSDFNDIHEDELGAPVKRRKLIADKSLVVHLFN